MIMNKRPFALTLTGPSSAIFDLSDALGFDTVLAALSVSVFEINAKQSYVQALYDSFKDADLALANLTLPSGVNHNIEQLPDEDWVSKSQAGLAPVTAGQFVIYGTHDAAAINLGSKIGLQVDAGLAFGTGHHGTTAGCLILFDKLITRGFNAQHICDLGCGAGVLAIAAAKVTQHNILATDIDEDAINVTRQNAVVNDVANHINAQQADGFEAPCFKGQSFDLIFANILAGPLMGLAPDIVKHMQPGGYVILSGILREQENTVADHFISHGLNVIETYPKDEWVSILARR